MPPTADAVTPPSACGRCCARPTDWAPICTSTWSRWTHAMPCSGWCWSSCRSPSSPTGRRPAWARQGHEGARRWPGPPPLTVGLVKGAYWDHELVQARQHGWEVPVFTDKHDCDRNFEALTRTLLDARPALRVGIASHNLRSVAHAIAYNRVTGGEDRDLE